MAKEDVIAIEESLTAGANVNFTGNVSIIVFQLFYYEDPYTTEQENSFLVGMR